MGSLAKKHVPSWVMTFKYPWNVDISLPLHSINHTISASPLQRTKNNVPALPFSSKLRLINPIFFLWVFYGNCIFLCQTFRTVQIKNKESSFDLKLLWGASYSPCWDASIATSNSKIRPRPGADVRRMICFNKQYGIRRCILDPKMCEQISIGITLFRWEFVKGWAFKLLHWTPRAVSKEKYPKEKSIVRTNAQDKLGHCQDPSSPYALNGPGMKFHTREH